MKYELILSFILEQKKILQEKSMIIIEIHKIKCEVSGVSECVGRVSLVRYKLKQKYNRKCTNTTSGVIK